MKTCKHYFLTIKKSIIMGKKQPFFQKNEGSFLTALFLFISIISIQSCNNDKKKEGEEKKELANPGEGAGAQRVSGPFAIVKLDKQDLLALFAPAGTEKLLIQFSDPNTSTSIMQAVAYGAKPNDVTTIGPKDLLRSSSRSWDTTGVKILGNNELSEKQIKKLIGGKINLAN